jgi:hypothetical protein
MQKLKDAALSLVRNRVDVPLMALFDATVRTGAPKMRGREKSERIVPYLCSQSGIIVKKEQQEQKQQQQQQQQQISNADGWTVTEDSYAPHPAVRDDFTGPNTPREEGQGQGQGQGQRGLDRSTPGLKTSSEHFNDGGDTSKTDLSDEGVWKDTDKGANMKEERERENDWMNVGGEGEGGEGDDCMEDTRRSDLAMMMGLDDSDSDADSEKGSEKSSERDSESEEKLSDDDICRGFSAKEGREEKKGREGRKRPSSRDSTRSGDKSAKIDGMRGGNGHMEGDCSDRDSRGRDEMQSECGEDDADRCEGEGEGDRESSRNRSDSADERDDIGGVEWEGSLMVRGGEEEGDREERGVRGGGGGVEGGGESCESSHQVSMPCDEDCDGDASAMFFKELHQAVTVVFITSLILRIVRMDFLPLILSVLCS